MRTTVVTVTYNSAPVLGGLLASLPPDTPLVVVDNASHDEGPARAAARPQTRVLRLPCNLGFGRACNAGAAGAQSEFVMFLNPDARLAPGALATLEAEADARPDFGAANPLIRDARGRARLKMTSVLPVASLPRPRLDVAGQMPVLSGGALFVRRAAFEAVGGFDPAIFLYHEDHLLCLRLQQAGYSLWHLPDAQADHAAGTGAPRDPATAQIKGYHMARARYYVIEKTAPGSGFRRTFWPALTGLIAPGTLVSARRRAKSLGQLAGALSARRDGGAFRPDPATGSPEPAP